MRTLFGTLTLFSVISLTTLTACEDKEESCDCAEVEDTGEEVAEPAEEPLDTAVEPEPATEPEDTGADTGEEDTGAE